MKLHLHTVCLAALLLATVQRLYANQPAALSQSSPASPNQPVPTAGEAMERVTSIVEAVDKKASLIYYYYYERLSKKDPACKKDRPRDLQKVLRSLDVKTTDFVLWEKHRPYRRCRLAQRYTLLDCPQAELTKSDIQTCKDLRPASVRRDWQVYIGIITFVLSATLLSLGYQIRTTLSRR